MLSQTLTHTFACIYIAQHQPLAAGLSVNNDHDLGQFDFLITEERPKVAPSPALTGMRSVYTAGEGVLRGICVRCVFLFPGQFYLNHNDDRELVWRCR